jgi:hypothetical protein
MTKETHKEERMYCPVAGFFLDLQKVSKRKSTFFEHLKRSRIEFLKAIRSLFDERINRLEKMGAKARQEDSQDGSSVRISG